MIYFAVYKLTLKKYLFIYMGASKMEHSLRDGMLCISTSERMLAHAFKKLDQ